MTRLIDADELHEIVNWSHEKPPYSKKKIHRLIDMARTVDAVPAQWLYDLAEQKEKVSAMIKGVVALWHMEQEKQNDTD